MHACIHTYTYIHTHALTHTHSLTHTCMHIHNICMRTCVRAWLYVYTHLYIYTRVTVCVCARRHIYTPKHTHTSPNTHTRSVDVYARLFVHTCICMYIHLRESKSQGSWAHKCVYTCISEGSWLEFVAGVFVYMHLRASLKSEGSWARDGSNRTSSSRVSHWRAGV